jgi:uncharacterized repeat protein (TIGR01451 family)
LFGLASRWDVRPRFWNSILGRRVARCGFLALLLGCAIASAQTPPITWYPVPTTGGDPLGLTVGPDGALWFTEFYGNKIGRITTSGVITEFPIQSYPYGAPQSSNGPYLIVAGPDGALWFTELYGNRIGRITTAGVITEYPLALVNGDQSKYPEGIVVGSDGALWFTETYTGSIGRITTTGTITEYPLPGGGPLGLISGPDGALWFGYGNSYQQNFVGRMTTSGALTSYFYSDSAEPYFFTTGQDGALWFTTQGGIGRVTTAGAITSYAAITPSDGAGTNPTGITAVPGGDLWFGGNLGEGVLPAQLGRITLGGAVQLFPLPASLNGSYPESPTIGPDGALWFTAYGSYSSSGANLIGRAVITAPILNILSNHSPGSFLPGEINATFQITVTNVATAAASSGTVTVTDSLPPGLSLISMAGAGWMCSQTTCSRSESLSAGGIYPQITVTVDVASNGPATFENTVTVSGGGSATASYIDVAYINQPTEPVMISPANGAVGVSLTPTLSWTTSIGATSYDVYFGPGSGNVLPPLATNTANTSYSPGPLTPGTMYAWLIYARNVAGTDGAASIFTFTTAAAVAVPNVVGQTQAAATTAITGAGLVLGTVTIAPSYTVASGLVISESPVAGTSVSSGSSVNLVISIGTAGFSMLHFVPVTPCRIADTRNADGPFGGPSIPASSSRDFTIPSSPCGIPANAAAYSLNLTVVPLGPLGFLSVWPSGQPQPAVSTLNSSDGRIKANAAIVPAGANGAITVFASDPTNVIVDINGYFISDPTNQLLAFYPLTPCRIADTRSGSGAFGAPSLVATVARSFPIQQSGCDVPANAQAYALNMTVVPSGPLGFLSAWPAGNPQPGSSTLNAPTGTVVANAAIVPAGAGGAIDVISTNSTDLLIDINGYFAPAGVGGLSFYAVTPCRIIDTRGADGTFGGPILAAAQARTVPIQSSACNIPSTASAYSLNATVVPPAPLGFLSLWNTGGSQPSVSTLNAYDGSIMANAAIVPAGTGGAINAFASNATQLILDINGYFAQ